MEVGYLSNHVFEFASRGRAEKAAKRLQSYVNDCSDVTVTLGWAKTAIARMTGHRDWTSLIRSHGERSSPSLLDHEIPDVMTLSARRTYQASQLQSSSSLQMETCRRAVDWIEPTGNANTFFRMAADTPNTLIYCLPIPPFRERSHYNLIEDATSVEDEFIYGMAAEALDELEGNTVLSAPKRRAGQMEIEFLPTDGGRVAMSISRSGTALLYEDEPRILRPTEIKACSLKWNISLLSLDGARGAVEVAGRFIAADVLQCAVWCHSTPRPAIAERIDVIIEPDGGIGSREAAEFALRLVRETFDQHVGFATEFEDFHDDEINVFLSGLIDKIDRMQILERKQ